MERICKPPLSPPLYTMLKSSYSSNRKRSSYSIQNLIPIIRWLPKYERRFLKGDVVSGITVAVIAIPQTLAYAVIAGLPPIYGLYSCIIPPIVYAIFGSSRELSIGIVAINSIIMFSTLSVIIDPAVDQMGYNNLALAATFFSGFLSIIFGLFKMGKFITFISPAVLNGFTTGSAVIIMITQLEGLLGVKAIKSEYSIVQLINIFSVANQTKWVAATNGFLVILLMAFFQYKLKSKLGPLVLCVISTLSSFLIYRYTSLSNLLPIVGFIPGGAPEPRFPAVDAALIPKLIAPALLLLVVGYIQSHALTQKYADKKNYKVDPNGEFLAHGITRMISACFKAVDTPGSFTRTAVNEAYGANTQISALITATLILIVLQYGTILLFYLPKSTLSAIVVMSVTGLLEFKLHIRMYKISRQYFSVAFITALATFLSNVQIGIGIGVLYSFLVIFYRISRPSWAILGEFKVLTDNAKEDEEHQQHNGCSSSSEPKKSLGIDRVYRNIERYTDATEYPNILIFRFDGNIYFLNAEYWRGIVLKLVQDRNESYEHHQPGEPIAFHDTNATVLTPIPLKVNYVILDFSAIDDIDVAGALAVVSTIEHVESAYGVRVLFASVHGTVRDVLWQTFGGISSDPAIVPSTTFLDPDVSISVNAAQPIEQHPRIIVGSRFYLNVAYASDFVKEQQDISRRLMNAYNNNK